MRISIVPAIAVLAVAQVGCPDQGDPDDFSVEDDDTSSTSDDDDATDPYGDDDTDSGDDDTDIPLAAPVTCENMLFDIRNVSFVQNSANDEGGALVAYFGSHPQLENVLFLGNYTDYAGGAIRLLSSYLTMTNATLADNGSANEGGAAWIAGGSTAWFTNVAFRANWATWEGDALALGTGENIVHLSHCSFWDSGPDQFADMADPLGVDGNFHADPMFLDLSAADPTAWDLHLWVTSPLIAAGDSSVPDPDGHASDIGSFGGPYANQWDMDWDGYPSWWLPGPYQAVTSPGMDCDDRDATVYPGSGC